MRAHALVLAGMLAAACTWSAGAEAQATIGVVTAETRITQGEGGFVGPLKNGDHFGDAMACAGDLDGDGIDDLLVGAPADDAGGAGGGAVWVLFLDATGAVRAETRIGNGSGGIVLANGDAFGCSIAVLGDPDGNGTVEAAVGAPGDATGGSNRGAVWLLELDGTGAVVSSAKVADGSAGLELDNNDSLGAGLAAVGDVDGDGSPDLVVGAPGDDDANASDVIKADLGAVYVLFGDGSGGIARSAKISETSGGFGGDLDNGDSFGQGVGCLGDLDGDGTPDVAVGAPGDDDGGSQRGAVWVLFLQADGSVRASTKISSTQGNFGGTLDNVDRFGEALSGLGDLDGDGVLDLGVGAPGDDDGGSKHGALWMLFLQPDGTVRDFEKVSDEAGGFEGTLANDDQLGGAAALLGDLDGDGVRDLAVGTPGGKDANGNPVGAFFTLLLTGGSVTLENGSGCNPIALFSLNPPKIGVTWGPFVDFGQVPGGDPLFNFLVVTTKANSVPFLPGGETCNELIVDLTTTVFAQVVPSGENFVVPIQPDTGLVGAICFSQGADIGTVNGLRLTNGLQVVIGF